MFLHFIPINKPQAAGDPQNSTNTKKAKSFATHAKKLRGKSWKTPQILHNSTAYPLPTQSQIPPAHINNPRPHKLPKRTQAPPMYTNAPNLQKNSSAFNFKYFQRSQKRSALNYKPCHGVISAASICAFYEKCFHFLGGKGAKSMRPTRQKWEGESRKTPPILHN